MNKLILYTLAVTTAVLAELLIHEQPVGVLVALAIYLPVHNRIWGRV